MGPFLLHTDDLGSYSLEKYLQFSVLSIYFYMAVNDVLDLICSTLGNRLLVLKLDVQLCLLISPSIVMIIAGLTAAVSES